ncbi:hypothetical protein K4F52_010368, partial [Lecanicillium sp. MT-2017a]
MASPTRKDVEATVPPPHSSNKPSLLHSPTAGDPTLVERTDGEYVHVEARHDVLDATGASTVALGDAAVTRAVVEQMSRPRFTHGTSHTSDVAERLARLLVEDPSVDLAKAYIVDSGSEAMESAMKLAVSYHIANGQPDRVHFVSRKQAHHGNTIGAMNISTKLGGSAPYGAAFNGLRVSHVSAAYPYRGLLQGESEEQYAERLLQELEAEFRCVGTEKVAAFVAETIGGSTAGCLIPPPTYLERVRRLCTRYGVLLILDEIMCGSGRTGTFFAFQAEGNVQPDIVTLGKGLAGGYLTLAAVLLRRHVHETIERGAGLGRPTSQAGDVSCAAALAVQQIVKGKGLLSSCAQLGEELGDMMRGALQGL